MSKLAITSRAPTRIDLAGGTVDIWPLYLFLQEPLTLNLGIDLFAETRLEADAAAGNAGVTLRSDDQNIEQKIAWAEVPTAHVPPQLELHLKLLRQFAKADHSRGTLKISTKALSPAGAGLGGSSALSVSIIGALSAWSNGTPLDPLREGERMIEIVRDVETTVIHVPAGLQDYYGAMFGGLQALEWGTGSHRRAWLPDDLLPEVESRLLLYYSGQSRNSGINNWALFKGFIDRENNVRERFALIAAATRKLEAALLARDWKGAAQAISDEWEVRRTLAAGISTPEMDHAFAVAQKTCPDRAGKICGAGGGGCFFLFMPNPADKLRVQEALAAEGMKPLPFHAVPRGLEVQVSRA